MINCCYCGEEFEENEVTSIFTRDDGTELFACDERFKEYEDEDEDEDEFEDELEDEE